MPFIIHDFLMDLTQLQNNLKGELFTDHLHQILYSTDASDYIEKPIGVVYPKDAEDVKKIIRFAYENHIPIIPRAAGTSLAGQVVGNGLVVDIARYMNQILELNVAERWVKVQPGVNRDELNQFLAPHGLFFAPETATTAYNKVGGMVGNNSCGMHSIIYGTTRDHTLSMSAILSNADDIEIKALTLNEYQDKCKLPTLEGKIYQNLNDILSNEYNREEIAKEFPKPSINRRNTGYAIDVLALTEPFTEGGEAFNLSKLIAGSEGTLAFITDITFNLEPLPPKVTAVIAAHYHTLDEVFLANLIALKFNPGAVELMDFRILECTKENTEARKNRVFVQGDPQAILMIEFSRDTREEIESIAAEMEAEMRKAGYGYYFPVLFGPDVKKVWDLRKAGLGLLANLEGIRRSVTVIEDTAIDVEDLPHFIADFKIVMDKLGLDSIYYAHIGGGEIHFHPLLNLKDPSDVALFKTVLVEVASIVKKHRGSLSGEHGDGRLRGEMIPFMLGEHNYQLLKDLKNTWDPKQIFNPGKITDTPSMNESLRNATPTRKEPIKTYFDFSKTNGIIGAAEQCNGSGVCLKSERIGGTMCPSFMATRDEKHVTRARANTLREFLIHSPKKNPFDHPELKEVLDLCLVCKACKSECPSNVDVGKLKMEFLQQYYDTHGIPLRARLIGYLPKINQWMQYTPWLMNFGLKNKFLSKLVFKILNFTDTRKLPLLTNITVENWFKKQPKNREAIHRKVYLFNDEFTNFNDSDVGIKTILLLQKLGYEVVIPKHLESGRTFLSKGLVKKAKQIATQNVLLLQELICEQDILIGIEPSAILSFRDEYPDLVSKELQPIARQLAKNALMFDEFFMHEVAIGNIQKNTFTTDAKTIKLHGHCHQKSVGTTKTTIDMLSFPVNYTATEIPSGCCGMAGSFGYEKEHFDISMKIGELVLFPEVRKTEEATIIAAPGTSCRHQIMDGTQRKSLHPIEIMWEALA